MSTEALVGGRWVQRGLIRTWEPTPGLETPADRPRHRQLLEERYFANAWWTKPDLEDDPQVTRRRIADMVADFERIDERTNRMEVA